MPVFPPRLSRPGHEFRRPRAMGLCPPGAGGSRGRSGRAPRARAAWSGSGPLPGPSSREGALARTAGEVVRLELAEFIVGNTAGTFIRRACRGLSSRNVPADARHEALARLLELNARRAAQEALAGASGAKARKAARGSRRQVPTRRGCSGEELSPPPSPSRAGVQMIHSR